MWEWMYEGFWDKLEHFCYKLCREESRAEDLTQEVFLKALQNRELLDSFNQRQCKAWLFATARNLYCDQLRRKMKEESLMREMLPEGNEEPPDETAEAALGTVDLETLLELLDPLDRAMFTLRYEQNIPSPPRNRPHPSEKSPNSFETRTVGGMNDEKTESRCCCP